MFEGSLPSKENSIKRGLLQHAHGVAERAIMGGSSSVASLVSETIRTGQAGSHR